MLGIAALLGNLFKKRESDLYESHIVGKRANTPTFWSIICACRVRVYTVFFSGKVVETGSLLTLLTLFKYSITLFYKVIEYLVRS